MTDNIDLLRVKFLPKKLEEGKLYFSRKYEIAGHLCPCGCGNKVITPIDSFEWHLRIRNGKPSLFPSIGNWQLDCKSHYWIINGKIEWAEQWSDKRINDAFLNEEHIRKLHFEKLAHNTDTWSIFEKIRKFLFR